MSVYNELAAVSAISYGDYSDGIPARPSDLVEILRAADVPAEALPGGVIEHEAARLADAYTVAHSSDQIPELNDEILGLFGSGFSATLFKDRESDRLILGVRGTQLSDPMDLFQADVSDIGVDGIAKHQAVALFNYYQLLITPPDQKALEIRLQSSGSAEPEGSVGSYVSGYVRSSSGELVPNFVHMMLVPEEERENGLGIIDESVDTIDVSGHSLGGHLAMVLSRIDPERVGEVSKPAFATVLHVCQSVCTALLLGI